MAKAVEEVTADDPWNVRADRVCLEAGNEYVNVEGPLPGRLREQVELSEEALEKLREVGASVPLASTLEYQTMLDYKEQTIRLLRRKLKLLNEGRSVAEVEARIDSTFMGAYALHAEELGLYVCGQGTGRQ